MAIQKRGLAGEPVKRLVEMSQVPASMVEEPATPTASARAAEAPAGRRIWDTVKSVFS